MHSGKLGTLAEQGPGRLSNCRNTESRPHNAQTCNNGQMECHLLIVAEDVESQGRSVLSLVHEPGFGYAQRFQ